jgi:hypothetical protein
MFRYDAGAAASQRRWHPQWASATRQWPPNLISPIQRPNRPAVTGHAGRHFRCAASRSANDPLSAPRFPEQLAVCADQRSAFNVPFGGRSSPQPSANCSELICSCSGARREKSRDDSVIGLLMPTSQRRISGSRPLDQRHNHACERFCLAPVLLQENREVERAPEAEPVPAHARGFSQGHVGEALE